MSLSSKKTVPFIHDKNMDDLKGKKKKKDPNSLIRLERDGKRKISELREIQEER